MGNAVEKAFQRYDEGAVSRVDTCAVPVFYGDQSDDSSG